MRVGAGRSTVSTRLALGLREKAHEADAWSSERQLWLYKVGRACEN